MLAMLSVLGFGLMYVYLRAAVSELLFILNGSHTVFELITVANTMLRPMRLFQGFQSVNCERVNIGFGL